MLLPEIAAPTTLAPSPSPSTTMPPNEGNIRFVLLTHGTHTDLGCTFQEDFCDFDVDGEGDFKFERFNGSQIPIIGADHNENQAGVFLYAHSEALQDPTPVLY